MLVLSTAESAGDICDTKQPETLSCPTFCVLSQPLHCCVLTLEACKYVDFCTVLIEVYFNKMHIFFLQVDEVRDQVCTGVYVW